MKRFDGLPVWIVVGFVVLVALLWFGSYSNFSRQEEARRAEEAQDIRMKREIAGEHWRVAWIFTNKDPKIKSIEIWLWPAKHNDWYDYRDTQYKVYAAEKSLGFKMLKNLRLGQVVDFYPYKHGDPWEVTIPQAFHGMGLIAEPIPKDDPRLKQPTAGTMAETGDWDGPLGRKSKSKWRGGDN